MITVPFVSRPNATVPAQKIAVIEAVYLRDTIKSSAIARESTLKIPEKRESAGTPKMSRTTGIIAVCKEL